MDLSVVMSCCEVCWRQLYVTNILEQVLILVTFCLDINRQVLIGYLCDNSVKVGSWTGRCFSSSKGLKDEMLSLNPPYPQTIYLFKCIGQGFRLPRLPIPLFMKWSILNLLLLLSTSLSVKMAIQLNSPRE